MNDHVTIMIYDEVGGAVPIGAEIHRDGDYIELVGKAIKIRILIDTLMILLGDDRK